SNGNRSTGSKGHRVQGTAVAGLVGRVSRRERGVDRLHATDAEARGDHATVGRRVIGDRTAGGVGRADDDAAGRHTVQVVENVHRHRHRRTDGARIGRGGHNRGGGRNQVAGKAVVDDTHRRRRRRTFRRIRIVVVGARLRVLV